jgi:branched-chain amino acid aminotransferase
MSGNWVYLNGRFVAAEAARVSVFDRGFLYGDGLFETVRAYSGRPFLPDAHHARLAAAAARIGIVPPFDAKEFADLLERTLDRNGLADALLRLTLTRGEGEPVPHPAGCGAPTVLVAPRAARRMDADAWRRGLAAQVVAEEGAGSGLKSTSFLPHVLALRVAREQGADEALVTNAAGEVAEGSVSNLFGVWDGTLLTPPLAAGGLPGVTRGVVLELAERLGLKTEERPLPPKALADAEELFVTSTGWEVMPLTRLDGRPVGTGMPGPVTERLQRAFRARVEAACGRGAAND